MSMGTVQGYELQELLKADMSLVFKASKGGKPFFLKVYRFKKADPVTAAQMLAAQEKLKGILADLGNITEDIVEHGQLDLSALHVGDRGVGADLIYKQEAYFQVKPWMNCINAIDYYDKVRQQLRGFFGDWSAPASRSGTVELLEQIRMLFGLLCGILNRCHEKGIVHQDLKPHQVLLVESPGGKGFLGKYRLMFADFDAAFLESEGPLQRVTTPGYQSYEHVSGKPLGRASDVFTMAMMIGRFLSLNRPLLWTRDEEGEGLKETEQAQFIRRCKVSLSLREFYPVEFEPLPVDLDALKRLDDLLARCLQPEPGLRPTAGELSTALLAMRLFKTEGAATVVPPPSADSTPVPAPADDRVLRAGWFRLRAVDDMAFTIKAGQTALDRAMAKAQFGDLADDDGNPVHKYFGPVPNLEFRQETGGPWQVRNPPEASNGFHLLREGAPDRALAGDWVTLEAGDRLVLFSRRKGALIPHFEFTASAT